VLRRLNSSTSSRRRDLGSAARQQLAGHAPGEEIVKEGEMDDRFYILVSGGCVR
jgi:CRP-like cAMP-binding protein